jgi:hypothetical protein
MGKKKIVWLTVICTGWRILVVGLGEGKMIDQTRGLIYDIFI